jgi:hypothetical protein
MSLSFSHPRLVRFHDRLAPYRGCWVIYADSTNGRYSACHELQDQHPSESCMDGALK